MTRTPVLHRPTHACHYCGSAVTLATFRVWASSPLATTSCPGCRRDITVGTATLARWAAEVTS